MTLCCSFNTFFKALTLWRFALTLLTDLQNPRFHKRYNTAELKLGGVCLTTPRLLPFKTLRHSLVVKEAGLWNAAHEFESDWGSFTFAELNFLKYYFFI